MPPISVSRSPCVEGHVATEADAAGTVSGRQYVLDDDVRLR